MPVSPSQSVLVVDSSEETREVLRWALRARGVEVYAAVQADQAAQLAADVEPDVIVYDLEAEGVGPSLCQGLTQRGTAEPAIVLLGTARRQAPSDLAGEFVAKPYHYAPLIRRIEALLEQSQSTSAAGRRTAA